MRGKKFKNVMRWIGTTLSIPSCIIAIIGGVVAGCIGIVACSIAIIFFIPFVYNQSCMLITLEVYRELSQTEWIVCMIISAICIVCMLIYLFKGSVGKDE